MPNTTHLGSRHTPWRRLASSIGAVATLWTCGGDETAPIVPQTLSIVSGNAQIGPAGDVTNEDFTVRLLGSDGQPFTDASVTWAAATGGGSVSPATAQTDASGLASARLTLGVAFVQNTVTASVSGVQGVTFVADAIDPCDFLRPISMDQTAAGSLRSPDCQLTDNTFIDFYELAFAQQGRAQIDLASTTFDPFLFFFDQVEAIAADDDGGTGTDALLSVLVPAGAYVIGANSIVPGTGTYDLSVMATGEDATNCDFVWIRPGVTTSQQIASTDCELDTDWYGDAFPILIRAGVTLTVTQQSTAFDAMIEVYDASDGSLLTTDDNGGGGTNARIDYTPADDVLLLVLTTTATAGQSGAYNMTVVSSTPLATRAEVGNRSALAMELRAGRRPSVRFTPRRWAELLRHRLHD